MGKKLHRSSVNRMLFGVCGGIGEYFNIDPTIIRLAWALLPSREESYFISLRHSSFPLICEDHKDR